MLQGLSWLFTTGCPPDPPGEESESLIEDFKEHHSESPELRALLGSGALGRLRFLWNNRSLARLVFVKFRELKFLFWFNAAKPGVRLLLALSQAKALFLFNSGLAKCNLYGLAAGSKAF